MSVVFSSATFPVHIPVIIIGAGAAGLIAALAAREAGAEVLVLERDALPRGSTALSAGLIPAAGTRWQAQAGIADTAEQFAADIMTKAHGEPAADAVACVTGQVGQVLEWLADRHGLEFSLITDFKYPGHSRHRMHGLPSRSGTALMDALREAAQAQGIEILCDAHVTTLFADANSKIIGLEYARPDGTLEQAGCDALILACNGYGGNKELVAQHIPALAGGLYFGHPGNQGDAIRWGAALGAATRHLSGHQGHGSVAEPGGILITWATITAGGIQVDLNGHRFSDEMQGYSEQAVVVLRQPGAVAWTVFDARIAAIARQFEDFREAEALGLILQGGDITALAAQMRVPADALRKTIEDCNEFASTGARDRFGRDFSGVTPLAPPLHAVRVTGALFHTQGGLAVDGQARVLRPDGTRLANLLAAGGAAAGVSGDAASGYLSGNGLLTAMALGFIAGTSAAAMLPVRQDV
jgi:fumarate reductase flavoprotein subunit